MNGQDIRKRLKRIFLYSVIVLLLGLLYGLFVKHTGIGIPCVFYCITGLKCPGCGITRMCVALMHLDIREAFYSHPVMLTVLPFLLVIFLRNLISYVKSGAFRLSRLENIIIYICIALLVVFAVVRNVLEI